MQLNGLQLLIYPLQVEHGAHEPSFFEYLVNSNVFNFLIAVIILGWLFGKFGLFNFFGDQRDKIAKDVERVQAEKAQAQARLKQIEARTAGLNAEVDEILSQARQSAETLSAQIIENAREEAGKIVENSKRRVELEQRAAANQLEQRLLQDAIEDARSLLEENMSQDLQKRSVEAFIEEMEQAGKAR